MKPGARGVFLIKPQFEAGREKVGKKGVVREPAVHEEVIASVLGYLKESGLGALGLDHSPIKGPEGNIEYLVWAQKGECEAALDIKRTVSEAHELLDVKTKED